MPAKKPGRRTTHRHRILRAELIADARRNGRYHLCDVCSRHIDLDLPGTLPLGPQLDHIDSWSTHPQRRYSRSNLRIIHKRCNLARRSSQ